MYGMKRGRIMWGGPIKRYLERCDVPLAQLELPLRLNPSTLLACPEVLDVRTRRALRLPAVDGNQSVVEGHQGGRSWHGRLTTHSQAV